MNRFSVHISWSDEDQEYLATCPEYPGLSAFGDSPEEALSEAQIALELFIDTYKEDELPLPQPQAASTTRAKLRIRSTKPVESGSIDRGTTGRHS